MPCLVAAAIISISINPLIYRTVDPVARWLGHVKPLAARLRLLERRRRPAVDKTDGEPAESSPRYRSVVIGYGPVGRTLVRLLRENEVEPTVVELNLPSVQALRAQGVAAIYGDASHRETLRGAGVPTAGTLILSSSNTAGNAEVIRLAKELNPKIRVLARTTYVSEVHDAKRAGADVVFPAEGEIALALAVAVLRDLGASGEQIDRERERVYRELMAKN
jgi:CPA2 family monovalent cation:H+ antiporter-2